MKYTMMKRFARSVAGLLLAVSLASCGGGGGDSGCDRYEGCDPVDPGVGAVSAITMNLSSTTLSNVSAVPVTATVTVVGAGGKTLEGVEVEFVVDQDAVYSRADTATDTSGRNSAVIDVGDDKSNREITVTATAGGKLVSKKITVTGSKIDATATPALIDPLQAGKVAFAVTDAAGQPQAGVEIAVTGSNGLPARSGQTDDQGFFEYAFTAPNLAGGTILQITATAAGVSKSQSVEIKAPAQVTPNANLTNASPSLQVNRTSVPVNDSGSSTNKIQVVSTFKTTGGVPIPNVRVIYKIAGFTAVGGTFSNSDGNSVTAGTPIALSGSDGRSTVFYIPETIASPNNQVLIQACYGESDADAQACASVRTLTQAVTVANEAVSVSIGTDGLIIDQAAELSYAQRYVVKVTDSAGNAKAGVVVSGVITTVNYRKGLFGRVSGFWVPANVAECAKEDLNDNDTIDAGEDLDQDGRLEPVRASVSFQPVGGGATATTNDKGNAIFELSYPKDKAYWNTVKIDVTGLVSGSEGRATRTQVLNYLIDDAKDEGLPAFYESEYGVITDTVTLTANRTTPNGTLQTSGTELLPCANFQ